MEEGFVVRFRGVRGNYPVPGSATLKYGGNTSCVEVWVDGRLIILDAGTGIVPLGDDLMAWHQQTREPIVASVFFSHTHPDHTQGFPFFTPAYLGSSTFYIFGPRTFDQDLEEALSRAMLPPTFPVSLDELPSLRIITNINRNEVILIGPEHEPQIRNIFRDPVDVGQDMVRISVLRSSFHPSGDVSVFKIEWNDKCMIYATDTEGVSGGDSELIHFSRGSDLLIHDAHYTSQEYVTGLKQGWGHSTPRMAADVAHRAGVKKLVLFHHDPQHDDAQLDQMEAAARAWFPNTVMAYEGLTLSL
jgi:phosphoribosyl 1,2-cyclic phosphodiesterase